MEILERKTGDELQNDEDFSFRLPVIYDKGIIKDVREKSVQTFVWFSK